MIPPILFVAGLKLIQGFFESRNSSPPAPARNQPASPRGLPPFTYSVVAVSDHRVREYVRQHKETVTAKALYDLFIEHGHTESAASLDRLASRLQREHPDCTILCCEFEYK